MLKEEVVLIKPLAAHVEQLMSTHLSEQSTMTHKCSD